MESTNNLPVAGIVRRFMALVYDTFLILGIALPYGAIVTFIRKALGGDTLTPVSGFAEFFILAGLWGCICIYYTWCWLRKGQTLGMKSWRIQLQTMTGSKPTAGLCFNRCVFATLLNACFGLGLIWCLIDKNGATLYDRFTGSRVVRLPKS